MAETIDNLSPRAKYPWHDWADGRAWRITRGEDFSIGVDSMRRAIYSHADANGLEVVTRMVGDSLEFQFARADAA